MNSTAFFISFVTVPKGNNIKDFFEKEFYTDGVDSGLYKVYQDNLNNFSNSMFEEKDTLDNELYKPIPYFIFGDYDLGMISLVDDFTIGNRIFSSVHTYKTKNNGIKSNSFKYEIISGISTKKSFKNNSELHVHQNQSAWLAVIRLKVNNGLLIGTGISIYDEIVGILKEFQNDDIQISILYSFDSYEMTLVCFSKKFSFINELVSEIRVLDIGKLQPRNKDLLFDESILGNIYKKKSTREEFYKCHLFTSTNTTVGIHLDYLFGKSKQLPEEKIQLTTHIDVKPGHLEVLKNQISNKFGIQNYNCITDDSLIISYIWDTNDVESLPYCFLNDSESHYFKHFNKLITKINYTKTERLDSQLLTTEHPVYLSDTLNDLGVKFDEKQIVDVRNKLCSIGISKLVTDRLLRIVGDYNDCIGDVHLFSYFIELNGAIKTLFFEIKNAQKNINEGKYDLQEFHSIVSQSIGYLEKGYFCRWQQGYNFPKINDINIEHNGGIHSILSSFNEVYLSYVNILNLIDKNRKDDAFLYVTGEEKISSTSTRLRINYFHLFNPEFFFVVVAKEAFNGMKSRLTTTELEYYNIIEKETIEALKIYIYVNSTEITEIDKVLKDFIENENGLIEYLFIDYLVFKFSFNSDFLLYQHWMLSTLVTTSENYVKENYIQDDIFISTIVRLLLILYVSNEEKAKITSEFILCNPFDSILHEQWMRFIPGIIKLFTIPGQKGNYRILELLSNIIAFAEKKVNEWSEYELEAFADDYGVIKEYDRRKVLIDKLRNDFTIKLFAGEIVYFDKEYRETTYVTAIILAYTSLIVSPQFSYFLPLNKSDCIKNISKFVLPRKNGKPQLGKDLGNWEAYSQYYYPYLLDTQGGAFLNTYNARKKYMQVRSALYASLADFNFKTKFKYFKIRALKWT